MKHHLKKRKSENRQAGTSMSNASNVICQEEECIGKLTRSTNGRAKDDASKSIKKQKTGSRSSMNFGDEGSCSDEECIGKT